MGHLSDARNSRPLSLATIISILFEHYILSCISPFVATTAEQFGFKPQHEARTCAYVCSNKLSYYVSKGTPVLSAFLDVFK